MENTLLDLEWFYQEKWATITKTIVNHIFDKDLDIDDDDYLDTVYKVLTALFKEISGKDITLNANTAAAFHKDIRQKLDEIAVDDIGENNLFNFQLSVEDLEVAIYEVMPEFKGVLDGSNRSLRRSYFDDLVTGYYILIKCKEIKDGLDGKAANTSKSTAEKRFKEEIKLNDFNFRDFKRLFSTGFNIKPTDISRFIKGDPANFDSELIIEGIQWYNWTPFFHIAIRKAVCAAYQVLDIGEGVNISEVIAVFEEQRQDELISRFKTYTNDNNIKCRETNDVWKFTHCYFDDLLTVVCVNELITIVQENIKYEKCDFKDVDLDDITKDTKFSELADVSFLMGVVREEIVKPFISLKDIYDGHWGKVIKATVKRYLGEELEVSNDGEFEDHILPLCKLYKKYTKKDAPRSESFINTHYNNFTDKFNKDGRVKFEYSNLTTYRNKYTLDELIKIVNDELDGIFNLCFTEGERGRERRPESAYFNDLIRTAYIVSVVKEIKAVKEGSTAKIEESKPLSVEEIRTKNAHLAAVFIGYPVCNRLSLRDFDNLLKALLVGNYYKKETKNSNITTAVDWEDVKSVSFKSLLNTPNESHDFTKSKLGKQFWEKVANKIGEFEDKVHAAFKAEVATKDKCITKADVQNLYTSIYGIQLHAYKESVQQEIQNIKRKVKTPHHTVIRNMLEHFNMYKVFVEDMKVVYDYKDEQDIVKDWENRNLFFEYKIPLYLLNEKCPHKELWEKFQPMWKNIYSYIYDEFRTKYGELLIENFQKHLYTLMHTKAWNNIKSKYAFSGYVEQKPTESNDIMSDMLPPEMLDNGLQPKITKTGENERKSAVVEMEERSLRFNPVIKFVF